MPAMIPLIAAITVLVVLALGVILLYNRLIRLRNRADNAWSQVDVQLRRRYDLIPNLVETVKGYAAHEQETFDSVTRARAEAQAATTVPQQAQAEQNLGSLLQRLFALAEDYPALRATENFQSLQADLSETEDKIAVARQIFNDTVLNYNNAVQTVPTNLVAAAFRMRRRDYFEIEDDARGVPRAEF